MESFIHLGKTFANTNGNHYTILVIIDEENFIAERIEGGGFGRYVVAGGLSDFIQKGSWWYGHYFTEYEDALRYAIGGYKQITPTGEFTVTQDNIGKFTVAVDGTAVAKFDCNENEATVKLIPENGEEEIIVLKEV